MLLQAYAYHQPSSRFLTQNVYLESVTNRDYAILWGSRKKKLLSGQSSLMVRIYVVFPDRDHSPVNPHFQSIRRR